MGRPQRKKVRRFGQNIEIIPSDQSPPRESGDTFSMKKSEIEATGKRTQRDIKNITGLGPDLPTSATQTQETKPSATVPASGESEMDQTSGQYRRRRARGIRTSSQGVTGSARVTRKELLGQ
tara:strand:+ start:313 stop:678 length:366 start_codon:yes stop_codon:yes gene_type:complete